jgi:hypothetical protein
MEIKKYGLIDISGGFGNQLFQYAFANYLATVGINVKINTYWYQQKNKFPRELIFNPNFFGLKEAGGVSLKTYELLDKYGQKKYYFSNNNRDINIYNLKRFNRLTGYWQDLKYLDNSKNFLQSRLKQNKQIESSLNYVSNESNILIHVRRSDYLKTNQALDILYYKKAIEVLSAKVNNPIFNVYTDDAEWVKAASVFKKVDRIFSSSSSKKDTIDTFALMLRNDHFIISNSTYSFLAAYLKQSKESIVTIPKPWMIGKNLSYNLYPHNWIKIERN